MPAGRSAGWRDEPGVDSSGWPPSAAAARRRLARARRRVLRMAAVGCGDRAGSAKPESPRAVEAGLRFRRAAAASLRHRADDRTRREGCVAASPRPSWEQDNQYLTAVKQLFTG